MEVTVMRWVWCVLVSLSPAVSLWQPHCDIQPRARWTSSRTYSTIVNASWCSCAIWRAILSLSWIEDCETAHWSTHPLCTKRIRRGFLFCWCFTFFSNFCKTNYLNIYRTDLHEICKIGRTLAVDERSGYFLIPRWVVASTNSVGKIDLYSTPCSSHDIR